MRVSFRFDGYEIYIARLDAIPRQGDFVSITDSDQAHVGAFVVQRVGWDVSFVVGEGDRLDVIVHLRRFRVGERGNFAEPSGYHYEGDRPRMEDHDA